MINPFKDVNWNPDLAAKRSFARSLVIGFPCIAVVVLLIKRFTGAGVWDIKTAFLIGGIGAGVGAVFYALPVIARPFYLAWYFLACCIGLVVSNVLLAGFFYLVFTPAGLLKRLFGRQNLKKGFDKSAASYWQDAEKVTDLTRYYRQF
jgi:hypothetical protein